MSKTDSLHYRLCCLGADWLKKRRHMKYITVELVTYTANLPDVWGYDNCNSVMIEVKTSHADFLNDKKKAYFHDDSIAIGNYRYYLCPKGVISVEELPAGWGLLNFEADTEKITEVKEPARQEVTNHEMRILYSLMTRHDIKPQIFNYRHKVDCMDCVYMQDPKFEDGIFYCYCNKLCRIVDIAGCVRGRDIKEVEKQLKHLQHYKDHYDKQHDIILSVPDPAKADIL